MPKKDNIILYIIMGIILIVIIGPKLGLFSSLPNDLQLFPSKYPLQYDFNLREGINKITLNEGIDLNAIYRIEYTVRGCWDDKGQNTNSETLDFNGKRIDYGFTSCKFLTYQDISGESPYIHYEKKDFIVTNSLDTRNLNIFLTSNPDLKVIERTLKIQEQVSCTRDSLCNPVLVNKIDVPTYCDLNYHKCSISSIPISSLGTTPNNIIITETQSIDNSSIIYVIGGFIILLILWNLFRR